MHQRLVVTAALAGESIEQQKECAGQPQAEKGTQPGSNSQPPPLLTPFGPTRSHSPRGALGGNVSEVQPQCGTGNCRQQPTCRASGHGESNDGQCGQGQECGQKSNDPSPGGLRTVKQKQRKNSRSGGDDQRRQRSVLHNLLPVKPQAIGNDRFGGTLGCELRRFVVHDRLPLYGASWWSEWMTRP